jgi:hypothetical protein
MEAPPVSELDPLAVLFFFLSLAVFIAAVVWVRYDERRCRRRAAGGRPLELPKHERHHLRAVKP